MNTHTKWERKTINSHITYELRSGFATKWIQARLGLARNELQNKTKHNTTNSQLLELFKRFLSFAVNPSSMLKVHLHIKWSVCISEYVSRRLNNLEIVHVRMCLALCFFITDFFFFLIRSLGKRSPSDKGKERQLTCKTTFPDTRRPCYV